MNNSCENCGKIFRYSVQRGQRFSDGSMYLVRELLSSGIKTYELYTDSQGNPCNGPDGWAVRNRSFNGELINEKKAVNGKLVD